VAIGAAAQGPLKEVEGEEEDEDTGDEPPGRDATGSRAGGAAWDCALLVRCPLDVVWRDWRHYGTSSGGEGRLLRDVGPRCDDGCSG
jgi:hypothetical protein